MRCAVDAATAYENILSAIKAAEDAAHKATGAAESAFQVGTWSFTSSLLDWLCRQLICLLSRAGGSVKNIIYSKPELVTCNRQVCSRCGSFLHLLAVDIRCGA